MWVSGYQVLVSPPAWAHFVSPSLALPLLALFRARHARLPASVRKVLLAFSILGDRVETPEGWNAILKSPSCQ